MKKVLALGVVVSFLLMVTTATPMLSSGDLPVRALAARAQIVAPSFISGEDFATVELGNPWDMDSTGDIDPVWTEDASSTPLGEEIAYTIKNGIATIVSNDTGRECNPPWPHRPLALNLGGKTIEADKYKYLTMRYKMDSPINGPCGSVFRIRWMYTNLWAAGRTITITAPGATACSPTIPCSAITIGTRTASICPRRHWRWKGPIGGSGCAQTSFRSWCTSRIGRGRRTLIGSS